MNLEKAFQTIKMNDLNQVPNPELVRMLRKRLLHIHDVFLWKKTDALTKLQQLYMETIPYFLLFGKNQNIEPKYVKVTLTPDFFNQDISTILADLSQECNQLLDENISPQRRYETLIQNYLHVGLYFGMSPKQIERELNKKEDLTLSLEFELHNHYIRQNFINKSLEKRG